MRNIRNILALTFGILVLSSCGRMEPEIVEEDYSYTPKEPNKENRDKIAVPPVDMLNQYVFFKDNDQKRTVAVRMDGEQKEVQPVDDVIVTVSTSFPAKEAFTAEIALLTEKEYPKTYTNIVMEGAQLLPQEMYQVTLTSVEFKVGEQEKQFPIKFKKELLANLDESVTYVIPLVIKVPEDKGLNLHNYFLVTLNKKMVKALPNGDNVKLEKTLPSGVRKLTSSQFSLSSDYAPTHLYKLTDGKKGRWDDNWWVSSGSNTELNVKLQKSMTIKAIVIYALSTSSPLTNFAISASNTNGEKFVEQGKIDVPKGQSSIVVTFSEAIEVDNLKIYGFKGTSSFVNIHEIEIYAGL